MDRTEIIYNLKSLIDDFESESETLSNMIDNWSNHNDPMSDPGLQYEQEMLVDKCWNDLVIFCKNNVNS
jgi:hypothetical protein